MNLQAEVSKVRDESRQLERNVMEIKSDVRLIDGRLSSINQKLDDLIAISKQFEGRLRILETDERLEVRIEALEKIHTRREWIINGVLGIVQKIVKYWWVWLLLIFLSFAVDIDFKIQNPHLFNYLTGAMLAKFNL